MALLTSKYDHDEVIMINHIFMIVLELPTIYDITDNYFPF